MIPHVVAITLASYFAWSVFRTGNYQTALQFVGPLLVVLVVHAMWFVSFERLRAGFAATIQKRALTTVFGLTAALLFHAIVAPMPARADGSGALQTLGMVVFCLFIIGVLATILAVLFELVFVMLRLLFSAITRRDDGETRLWDWGSLTAIIVVMAAMCGEGLTPRSSFSTAGEAVASRFVMAEPATVWRTLQTATAPSFPLPAALSQFPRPVEVALDEGVVLGSRRIVRFHGREGAGRLMLSVTERTPHQAVFTVLLDTTPYARWIEFRNLSYTVEPEGDGTRLSVRLGYDRLLAPSWFFSPLMKSAAFLAMHVLARDVKARVED